MHARQSVLASPLFGADIKKLLPIITEGGSDSAMLDNAVELLSLSGRSLPHVMSMLIPEAWDHDATMPDDIKAFYEYHASLMEPWDGPAAVAFTDGRVIGAKLDRNGLRPGRYLLTSDGLVVMASEAGVLPVQARRDSHEGPAGARPDAAGRYRAEALDLGRRGQKAAGGPSSRMHEWLKEYQITLDHLPDPSPHVQAMDHERILMRQRAFGYTDEDL